jgi:hypothetical protein
MLPGEKPFAAFSAEPNMTPEQVGDADFAPYVRAGRILQFNHFDPVTGIEYRTYCLPTEEWRAKVSLLIHTMCLDGTAHRTFTTADLHRLEGTLLGYSKEGIEIFIARSLSLSEKSNQP